MLFSLVTEIVLWLLPASIQWFLPSRWRVDKLRLFVQEQPHITMCCFCVGCRDLKPENILLDDDGKIILTFSVPLLLEITNNIPTAMFWGISYWLPSHQTAFLWVVLNVKNIDSLVLLLDWVCCFVSSILINPPQRTKVTAETTRTCFVVFGYFSALQLPCEHVGVEPCRYFVKACVKLRRWEVPTPQFCLLCNVLCYDYSTV